VRTGSQVISVAHVITTLDVGGAERALVRLATALADRGVRQLVVSLKPPGPLAADLRRAGVPVHGVSMRPERAVGSGLAGLTSLTGLLRRAAPDVVQTWMYHADVLGGLAARAAGCGPVAWNVRHADLPLEGYGASTAALGLASVPLAHVLPRVVVTNSASGLERHVARGYPRARMRLIPNGVPLPTTATPDRRAVRAELGLPEDALVIGRVGRDHPQKDLPTLLHAVALLRERGTEAVLAVVGEGYRIGEAGFDHAVAAAGLTGIVHGYGRRADAATLPAAFDLAVSSSAFGENCPNAVLEAMAVGVPVVTTDVGDSARVVGDTGLVVPPRDPAALAAALERLSRAGADERHRLGAAAARRIVDHYSVAVMADRYEALYRELAAG
jgi:glycosyltransferase involved in cell wall biosynthesis